MATNAADLSLLVDRKQERFLRYMLHRGTQVRDESRVVRSQNALGVCLDSLFIWKHRVNPGFYHLIRSRTRPVEWFWRHIRLWVLVCLTDVLLDRQTTMASLQRTASYSPESDLRVRQRAPASRRRRSRTSERDLRRFVHEYYADSFMPTTTLGRKEPRDEREEVISTAFTVEDGLFDTWCGNWADKALDFEIRMRAGSEFYRRISDQKQMWFDTFKPVRRVDPEHILALKRFKEIVREAIDAFERAHRAHASPRLALMKQLVESDLDLERFFDEIVWRVDLRWFNKVPLKYREPMLRKSYEANHGPKLMRQGVDLLLLKAKESPSALDWCLQCMEALLRLGFEESARAIASRIAAEKEPIGNDLFIWRNNLAVAFRVLGTPRKMLRPLTENLEAGRKEGNVRWVVSSSTLLAEAYRLLDERERCRKFACEAYEALKGSALFPGERTQLWRFMADTAHRIGDNDWEAKALAAGIEVAESAGFIAEHEDLGKRLLTANARFLSSR